MNRSAEEELILDALSKIETPACDIETAVSRSLHGKAPACPVRRFPRTALLAAALAALLAVGAAAVGISSLWARFFASPIPPCAVTIIGLSQTAGGYTLTLEDAMVDDNGAILLFTLRRADGAPIDPKASLSTNSMNVELLAGGEHFMGGGGFENPVLSDDGKALTLCCELRGTMQGSTVGLAGKPLTFLADGVAVQLFSPDSFGCKPGETVDLSPLSGVEIPDFSNLEFRDYREDHTPLVSAIEAQQISIPLPLDKSFPQYRIRGAVTLKDGLALAITQGVGQSGEFACTGVMPEALIDTRNGTRYELPGGTGVDLSGGEHAMLYTYEDCPLTAADLPYLQLEVSYAMDHILSDAPFSLTFTPDSGAAMILPLSKENNISGATLHPTELRLSALGITLYFSDGMDAVFDAIYPSKTAPVVVLKDGTVVSTVWQGGSGGPGGCNAAFQARSEDGARVFLDTSQVASVSLGGETLWTTGDYALTLTDVMADDEGAVILLALTRTDGGPVNPEACLQGNTVGASLRVDGEAFGTVYPRGSSLSDDGKTLYFCYELRKVGNTDGSVLSGKALTFQTGGVVIPMTAGQAFPGRELTVPLSQPLPLAAEFPSFRFVAAEATGKGLAVTVTRGLDEYGGLRCIRAVPALLTDSRNGKEYSVAEGEYLSLPDGTAAYRAYYGGGDALTLADLPYLSATYSYTIDKVLSDQPAALAFTPTSGSAQIVPLDETVTVRDAVLQLNELRFSALGLSLRLSSDVEDSYVLYDEDAAPVVHLKDGSAVHTQAQGGSGSTGRASVSFQPQNQDGQRIFLDTDQIASVSLDGTTIWRTKK